VLLTRPVGQIITAAQITAYFHNNNFPEDNFIVESAGLEGKKPEKFKYSLQPDTKLL
jgi:hypothetical protein